VLFLDSAGRGVDIMKKMAKKSAQLALDGVPDLPRGTRERRGFMEKIRFYHASEPFRSDEGLNATPHFLEFLFRQDLKLR